MESEQVAHQNVDHVFNVTTLTQHATSVTYKVKCDIVKVISPTMDRRARSKVSTGEMEHRPHTRCYEGVGV